jgi:hypothetical protein
MAAAAPKQEQEQQEEEPARLRDRARAQELAPLRELERPGSAGHSRELP